MKNSIKKATTLGLLAATLALPMHANAWWGSNGPAGSNWGPFNGFGNMMGDMDFNMSFRGNARSMFDGFGFTQPVYGYGYPYAPAYVAYAAPAPQPVAPAKPAIVVVADGDKDGVADTSDLCPSSNAGAEVDAFGCEVDSAIVLRGVNFHTNSDKLTDQSLEILNRVAATLAANPGVHVQVAGHTDSQGDDAYNKDLSQRRATSVADYLVSKGASKDSLQSAGYGEEQPVADNTTVEGRAENRRVELVRQDG